MTADFVSNINAEPLYYAKDGRVMKRPVVTISEDGGKSIAMGYPVVEVTDYVGPEAAGVVAKLMNCGQDAPDIIMGLLTALAFKNKRAPAELVKAARDLIVAVSA